MGFDQDGAGQPEQGGGVREAPTDIRTELLDASGAVVTTVDQEVGQRDWANGPVGLDPVPLSTSDLARAGQGWIIRSAVAVGGTTVVSCTVGAEDWSATS